MRTGIVTPTDHHFVSLRFICFPDEKIYFVHHSKKSPKKIDGVVMSIANEKVGHEFKIVCDSRYRIKGRDTH